MPAGLYPDAVDNGAAGGKRRAPMSFALYMVGFVLVIAGVAWALVTAGVAVLKIAIVCMILLGLAILSGVVKTRPKDPPR